MLEHMRPWPDLDRISAVQAAERMAAGICCAFCRAANKKLKPVPRRKNMLGCTGCLREQKKEQKAKRQDAYQRRNFDLTLAEKTDLIEFQGGGCICAPWTGYDGSTRSLSTDHDHQTGEVRGALCKHCNDLLGRVRDDPEYFRRMVAYLVNPPAKRLFGSRVVPGHGVQQEIEIPIVIEIPIPGDYQIEMQMGGKHDG
jgi:hypothetical protein